MSKPTRDVVGERLWNERVFLFAHGDVPSHQLHVEWCELCWWLDIVLMYICDVLSQPKSKVHIKINRDLIRDETKSYFAPLHKSGNLWSICDILLIGISVQVCPKSRISKKF